MILDWWYSCWAYLFGLKPHYFIFGVILMGLQLFNLGLLLAFFWAYFDLGLLWFVHESILLQLDSFLLSSRCPTCGGLDFLIESKLVTYIRAPTPKALAKGFGRLVWVGRQLIFGRRILVALFSLLFEVEENSTMRFYFSHCVLGTLSFFFSFLFLVIYLFYFHVQFLVSFFSLIYLFSLYCFYFLSIFIFNKVVHKCF